MAFSFTSAGFGGFGVTDPPDKTKKVKLNLHDHFFVPMKSWHQIINPNDIPCHIIEIQYGSEINENDIERLSYYEAKNK